MIFCVIKGQSKDHEVTAVIQHVNLTRAHEMFIQKYPAFKITETDVCRIASGVVLDRIDKIKEVKDND